MDELSFLWQSIFSAVLCVMAWSGNRAVSKIDRLYGDIEKLKRDAITRADLKADVTANTSMLLEAIERGNRDVISRIGAVEAKADKANQRLDVIRDEEISRLRAQ